MDQVLEALGRFVVTGEPPRPESEAGALALAAAARDQGLAGLLDEAVHGSGPGWPARAAVALRDAHRAALQRGVQLSDASRRARALIAGEGLRVLPMKGAALVGRFYESPGERPMADVDLLALGDWRRAAEVLVRQQYRVIARADHAWMLEDPGADAVVELHRGLATAPELFPFGADALWARRVGEPGEERPSSEDLLVQLAVHAAFQHGMAIRLGQYLDFRRVCERGRPDTPRLLAIAVEQRAEGCLLAALEVSRVLVAAPVAGPLLEELRRRAPRRLLRRLAGLLGEPLALVAAPAPPLRIAAWRLALVGRRRLELLARTLLPGSPDGTSLERASRAARRGLRLTRQLGRRS